MNSEQMIVLQMLCDGKINAAQAERLLVVLARRRTHRRREAVPHRTTASETFLPPDIPTWVLPVQM